MADITWEAGGLNPPSATVLTDVRTRLLVETTTQLDARDTDNRDRTNHTGTQTASTISDPENFPVSTAAQSAIDAKANLLDWTTAISLGANSSPTGAQIGNVVFLNTYEYDATTSSGSPAAGDIIGIQGAGTVIDETGTYTLEASDSGILYYTGSNAWRLVVLNNNGQITTDLALKAPLASPVLTGTPTAPTATAGTNTTQLATTAFVVTEITDFLDKTGDTATGAITFSGGATRTSADTNNANELLTVTQRDIRELETSTNVTTAASGLSGNNSGTAGVISTVHGASDRVETNAGTAATGWARSQLFRNITTFSASSGAGILCAKNLDLAGCSHFFTDTDGIGVNRIVIGDTGTGAPAVQGANALAARGWGFETRYDTVGGNHEVKIFSHDGTTYSESSWTVFSALDTPNGVAWFIRKSGSTISLWMNTTQAANVDTTTTALVTHSSNVPTSGNTTGQYISQLSTGDGVTAISSCRTRTRTHIKCRVY